MSMRLSLGLLGGVVLSLTSVTPAAMVSVSSVQSANTDYDLTNVYGIGDWAYWQNNAADGGTPLNQKAGADLIGPMSILNTAGTLNGSSSGVVPFHDFIYTDGTSPVSGRMDNVIGLFNGPVDVVGSGVKVEVTSPTADPFTIYVWAAAYQSEAQLTATIGAATDSGTFASLSSGRTGQFYTIDVTPDSAGQIVTLSLALVVDNLTQSNSNVSMAAVAVTPEPAAMSLSLLGGLMMLSRRRRR